MLESHGREVELEIKLRTEGLKAIMRCLGAKFDDAPEESGRESAAVANDDANVDEIAKRHQMILAQQRAIDGKGK